MTWHRQAARTAHERPAAPTGRNRYVDLVRLFAIVVVVVGHWLDTTILIVAGYPVGESALGAVGYMRWLTLLLQIMPMFFLAGGYAAAASWPSWQERGGGWAGWTYGRFVRLLRPTSWFVAIMASAAALAGLLGAPPSVLAQAGWGVALQLWFLPVYLLLLVLAVPLLAAWRRAGWLGLAAAIAVVAVIDVLVRVIDVAAAGWLSYLVVPAAGFLLGMAWRAGALAARGLAIGMVVGGVLVLLVLIAGFGYPPWMIGVPGEPPANTSPPNLALMAYAAAQVGLVLLLEQPLRRFLERPRAWAAVVRGNSVVMTMYLWHMVPVLILGAVMVVAGLPTGPRAGTVAWWLLRILWIGALALLLVGVIGLVGRFERPGPPRRYLAGWMQSALLLVCAALTGFALSRLALEGFAPSGRLAVAPLAVYATGMLALWLAGRADPALLVGSGESGGSGGDSGRGADGQDLQRADTEPEHHDGRQRGDRDRRPNAVDHSGMASCSGPQLLGVTVSKAVVSANHRARLPMTPTPRRPTPGSPPAG